MIRESDNLSSSQKWMRDGELIRNVDNPEDVLDIMV